jgi:flagellar biosynthetic protein FlhB
MEETEQDKSESATPYKLMRARTKGVVSRGADLGFFTGLAAFAGYVWAAGDHLAATVARAAHSALVASGSLSDGPGAAFAASGLILFSVVQPLALMAAAVFLVVLLFEIVQTGVVFSTEPLRPDFSKLNPAKGLKRLFTWRLLIETGKNVLKLGVYTGISYLIVREAVQIDTGSIADGFGLSAIMRRVAFKLLLAFVLGALLFAVIDQLIVRRDFGKKMRMSRRELRREAREREGEPRLKQKRKQLHAEFVKMSQSLRNLRKADVLVTNPEHIALALRYDRRTMHAPIVVSIGTNLFAQRLKRMAFIYGIPIVENRALARELYRKAALNKSVPEHCFRPVADIYNSIRRKSATGGTGQ